MASSSSQAKETPSVSGQNQINHRLKTLYPAVNEDQTPLPRSWSPKDKYNYIGLSQNNLRVHYKGTGKTHKDAASVRATHPIPASCGIYYFEVKIISKGRDGYMGVGLSTQGVNMNRLPGWERQSYGYHGDDGHSFCSSGTGQAYGPTFTTGDVIGCCINLIDNTCFYTKNGVNLGVAFTDLPANLYPTVGLQTPGEVVEANFGQSPFIFDIEDYMKEWRLKTKTTIERFPINCRQGEWQTALHRMVSTYLVHHGYCATAEAFAKSTGQAFEEEITSMKNRQRIQKLVLAGRMGEAIETTQSLYPGLLERSQNLLFMLKCRQFVEMVNGTDSEMRGLSMRSPRSQHSSGSNKSSPSRSPNHYRVHGGYSSCPGSPSSQIIQPKPIPEESDCNMHQVSESVINTFNSGQKCDSPVQTDEAMDTSDNTESVNDRTDDSNGVSNGTMNGSCMNGDSQTEEDKEECDMELEPCSSRESSLKRDKQLCGGNQAAIEKMLQFGRELQSMSVQLKQEYGKNEANKKAMEDAFSLLAYADPWNSPVGYQLDPVQREPVCASLNSAILESHGLPKQPPLELAISQTSECMKLMSRVGIGACAFADVNDYLH